jgi:Zn-dependent protease
MVLSSLSGYGIGWGRPAPMDARKMRDPRWDFFIAVIAGPISNVVQAVVYAIVLRILIKTAPGILFAGGSTFLGLFLILGVAINLSLAIFNMFPLGPLDGHWLLGLLLPEKARFKWFQWNRQYGQFALIATILIGQWGEHNGHPEIDLLGNIMGPILTWVNRFFVGGLS